MTCQFCGRSKAVTTAKHIFGSCTHTLDVCRRCKRLMVEVPTALTEQESDRRMEIAAMQAENRAFGY